MRFFFVRAIFFKKINYLNIYSYSQITDIKMSEITDQEIAEIRNLLKVNDIVRRSENPHPMTMVVVIVGIIMIMVCIYTSFIKRTVSGIWVDGEDNSYNVAHNRWTDTILVNNKHHGLLKGHIVIIYLEQKMQMGIWMKNKIKWMDGEVWYCSHGY
jgi:hypothetical protein